MIPDSVRDRHTETERKTDTERERQWETAADRAMEMGVPFKEIETVV